MFLDPKVRVAALVASGVLSAAVLATPLAATPTNEAHGLTGVVKCSTAPISAARVYAYQVADFSLTRVTTDSEGQFLFRSLPAGVYKIIAHKTGFVPAVVLFTRATVAATDYLEFELTEEKTVSAEEDADFWSVRRKIPGDVLRSIQLAEAAEAEGLTPHEPTPLAFETEFVAGFDQRGERGSLQRKDGAVAVSGSLNGNAEIAVRGQFQEVTPNPDFGSAERVHSGESQALSVSVLDAQGKRSLNVSTALHEVDRGFGPQGEAVAPVTFERYELGYSEQYSPRARSEIRLSYMDESNFNSQTRVAPWGIPRASNSWQLDGRYSQEVNDSFGFRTGASIRQLTDPYAILGLSNVPGQRVDAFGVASSRPRPGLRVEYGLYTSMRDGSLSVSPQAGIVVDMGDHWRADASVREQVSSGDEVGDFSYAYYDTRDYDGAAEGHLYRVGIEHRASESQSIRLGASHREIRDTVRVFFNQDFFDQMESIYLVRGDELPEFDIALSRRLGRQILATLASQYGDGGGGLYLDSRGQAFENHIRYLVTSIDTQFLRTATGVLLAFHKIEQDLDPISSQITQSAAAIDRLQVRLTQELGFLTDIGADWALLLDVELRRGLSAFERARNDAVDPDELRSQVAGGIAVKF